MNINVRNVPDMLNDALVQIADERNITRQKLIIDALQKYVDDYSPDVVIGRIQIELTGDFDHIDCDMCSQSAEAIAYVFLYGDNRMSAPLCKVCSIIEV